MEGGGDTCKLYFFLVLFFPPSLVSAVCFTGSGPCQECWICIEKLKSRARELCCLSSDFCLVFSLLPVPVKSALLAGVGHILMAQLEPLFPCTDGGWY